ncbi:21885_t:CDS:2, partial [Racocetra persica]
QLALPNPTESSLGNQMFTCCDYATPFSCGCVLPTPLSKLNRLLRQQHYPILQISGSFCK